MKDYEKDKEYWDERLPKYDREGHKVWSRVAFRLQEDFLRKKLRKLKPSSVMEIGFGTGRVLRIVRQELPNARIVGHDQSDAGLEAATEKVPDAELVTGGWPAELFGDEEFDLVLLVEVLLHNRWGDCRNLMQEAMRIGKKVLIVDPSMCGEIQFTGQGWCLV